MARHAVDIEQHAVEDSSSDELRPRRRLTIGLIGAVLTVAVVFHLARGGALLGSDVTDARLIGGDTDDNGGGCYVSAGYSYCSSLGKCVRSWEESCPDR